MCFPFRYCAFCESLTSPFQEYVLKDPKTKAIYFCSAECRLKYFERTNRTIPEPIVYEPPVDKQDYGVSKKYRRTTLATGRYDDPSYYSI